MSPIQYARRINRSWITRGSLATNTDAFLDEITRMNMDAAEDACQRAVSAARAASKEGRDPKPEFYSEIFRDATKTQRDFYLRDHFFTRLLSVEKAMITSPDPEGPLEVGGGR